MLTAEKLNNLPKNPNTEVAMAGKSTLLYIESDTDWLLVGGQRNSPLEMTADALDGSHKTSGGWATQIPGMKSWNINYDGLMILSDEGLQILEYAFRNDEEVHVRVMYKNGWYREGWAFVTSFSDDNAHDGIHTISCTLTGNGEISEFQQGGVVDGDTSGDTSGDTEPSTDPEP